MHEKDKGHDYASEAKAKGGSVPPDLRRNSKARSHASQVEHMGGHNKAEQREIQHQEALQRDLEISIEEENY